MANGFAKGLMVGCALSLAVGAVAYSQAGAILPLTPKTVTPVAASAAQAHVGNAVDVSAFVSNTKLMAQPAVATMRDIARTQTLQTALGGDEMVSISANTETDDLINQDLREPQDLTQRPDLHDGFAIPQPTMRSRPQMRPDLPVLAVNVAQPVTRPLVPATTVRSGTASDRSIKTMRWSTGEFR